MELYQSEYPKSKVCTTVCSLHILCFHIELTLFFVFQVNRKNGIKQQQQKTNTRRKCGVSAKSFAAKKSKSTGNSYYTLQLQTGSQPIEKQDAVCFSPDKAREIGQYVEKRTPVKISKVHYDDNNKILFNRYS